jgi:transcriptional regulator with XRE-family HTH domain
MDTEIAVNMLSRRFAERVKAKRTRLGISQEVVADRAGISRQALSFIESGETQRVSLEVALALAEALRTRLSDLVKP